MLKERIEMVRGGRWLADGVEWVSLERFRRIVSVGRRRFSHATILTHWKRFGCPYRGGATLTTKEFRFLTRNKRRLGKGSDGRPTVRLALSTDTWFRKDEAARIRRALLDIDAGRHAGFDGMFSEDGDLPRAYTVARAAGELGWLPCHLWRYVNGAIPAAFRLALEKRFPASNGKLPTLPRRVPGKRRLAARAVTQADLYAFKAAIAEATADLQARLDGAAGLKTRKEICKEHQVSGIADRQAVYDYLSMLGAAGVLTVQEIPREIPGKYGGWRVLRHYEPAELGRLFGDRKLLQAARAWLASLTVLRQPASGDDSDYPGSGYVKKPYQTGRPPDPRVEKVLKASYHLHILCGLSRKRALDRLITEFGCNHPGCPCEEKDVQISCKRWAARFEPALPLKPTPPEKRNLLGEGGKTPVV
jgi:hypothetical protein